ncbi:Arf guanine nucleotide exchange factor sbh1 [Savitreella phatthalungensis]
MSDSSRPSSPAPPGGVRSLIRRRAAKDQSAKEAAMRPLGTRAAGAGGSNATMLKLYTDDAPGLKVDPLVIMVLSVAFVGSVFALHIIAKIISKLS